MHVIILSKFGSGILENKIKKENIIFIALVYNWLANKKMELEGWDVLNYLDKVCEYLKCNFNREVVMDSSNIQDEEWDYYNEMIKEMIEFKYKSLSGFYVLKTLENIDYLYERQSEEVIKATLQKDALSCIHLEKESLDIKTDYKWVSKTEGIYTLEGKSAVQSVKKDLEEKGCQNIQIGHPTSAQLEGDKGFYVSYTCKEPIETVNVLARVPKNNL